MFILRKRIKKKKRKKAISKISFLILLLFFFSFLFYILYSFHTFVKQLGDCQWQLQKHSSIMARGSPNLSATKSRNTRRFGTSACRPRKFTARRAHPKMVDTTTKTVVTTRSSTIISRTGEFFSFTILFHSLPIPQKTFLFNGLTLNLRFILPDFTISYYRCNSIKFRSYKYLMSFAFLFLFINWTKK